MKVGSVSTHRSSVHEDDDPEERAALLVALVPSPPPPQWGRPARLALFLAYGLMTGLAPVILELSLVDPVTQKKTVDFIPQMPYLLAFAASVLCNSIIAWVSHGYHKGFKLCYSVSGMVRYLPVSISHVTSDSCEIYALRRIDGPFRVILNQLRLPGYTFARRILFGARQTAVHYGLVLVTTLAVLSYTTSRIVLLPSTPAVVVQQVQPQIPLSTQMQLHNAATPLLPLSPLGEPPSDGDASAPFSAELVDGQSSLRSVRTHAESLNAPDTVGAIEGGEDTGVDVASPGKTAAGGGHSAAHGEAAGAASESYPLQMTLGGSSGVPGSSSMPGSSGMPESATDSSADDRHNGFLQLRALQAQSHLSADGFVSPLLPLTRGGQRLARGSTPQLQQDSALEAAAANAPGNGRSLNAAARGSVASLRNALQSLRPRTEEQRSMLVGVLLALVAVAGAMCSGLTTEYLFSGETLPNAVLACRSRCGTVFLLATVIVVKAAYDGEFWKVYTLYGIHRGLLTFSLWMAARDIVVTRVLRVLNVATMALGHVMGLAVTFTARLIVFREIGHPLPAMLILLIVMLLLTMAGYKREQRIQADKLQLAQDEAAQRCAATPVIAAKGKAV